MQSNPSTNPVSDTPSARYSLRQGLGLWQLTFEGRPALLKHEKGIYYVAYLLLPPPPHPIHGLNLAFRVQTFDAHYQPTGISELVAPATGEASPLERHARLQERNLALDNAQST